MARDIEYDKTTAEELYADLEKPKNLSWAEPQQVKNKPRFLKRLSFPKYKPRFIKKRPSRDKTRTQTIKAQQRLESQRERIARAQYKRYLYQFKQQQSKRAISMQLNQDVESDPRIRELKLRIQERNRRMYLTSPQYKDMLRRRKNQLLQYMRTQYNILGKNQSNFRFNMFSKENPDAVNLMQSRKDSINILKPLPKIEAGNLLRSNENILQAPYVFVNRKNKNA